MRYLGSGVRSIAEGIIEKYLNTAVIMGRLRLM